MKDDSPSLCLIISARLQCAAPDLLHEQGFKGRMEPIPTTFPEDPEAVVMAWDSEIGRRVEIQRADLDALRNMDWINGATYEFGLKYVAWASDSSFETTTRASPDEVHVTSSFLLTKLRENGYNGVRNWFRRVDIFSKAYLLIPVNHSNNHWTLAVVCHPAKIIAPPISPISPGSAESSLDSGPVGSYGEDMCPSSAPTARPLDLIRLSENWSNGGRDGDGAKRSSLRSRSTDRSRDEYPSIIFMDGMRRTRPQEVSLIRNFLIREAIERRPQQLRELGHVWDSSSEASIRAAVRRFDLCNVMDAAVPMQPNGWDCGPYAVHFGRRFVSNPRMFEQIIMNEQSTPGDLLDRRTHPMWLPDMAVEARRILYTLMLKMAAEWLPSR
ncbi:hypothetical protein OC834_007136 [Tilletia horrida]|nr:hypothetical protein OC834_007136 [Tilletia horrida]